MKTAISAKVKDVESLMDPRFGHAERFIVFDTSDNSII